MLNNNLILILLFCISLIFVISFLITLILFELLPNDINYLLLDEKDILLQQLVV